MDWMETGRNPDTYRGADKRSIYQRKFFESIDVIPDIMDELYDINSKQLYMTLMRKKRWQRYLLPGVIKSEFVTLHMKFRKKFFNRLLMR
jgi:RNA polymerase sigma-70 factor (ECF subfamily)